MTTKPRTVLLSPNIRRPRTVSPPSSGMSSRRDMSVRSHSECARPAATNAAVRNSAQTSESGFIARSNVGHGLEAVVEEKQLTGQRARAPNPGPQSNLVFGLVLDATQSIARHERIHV